MKIIFLEIILSISTSCSNNDSIIPSGVTLLGGSGSGTCAGVILDDETVDTNATATQILEGFEAWDASGNLLDGTMPDNNSWDLSSAFPGTGYYSGVTNVPAGNSICTNSTILGVAGSSTCLGVGIPANFSGLKLWIKAEDLISFSDGDSVKSIFDASQNNNNAYEYLGKPTYNDSTYAFPVLDFTAANRHLRSSSFDFTALTIMLAMHTTNTTNDFMGYLSGGPASGLDYDQANGFHLDNNSIDGEGHFGANLGVGDALFLFFNWPTQMHVLTITLGSDSAEVFVNGVSEDTDTYDTPATQSPTIISIGDRTNSGLPQNNSPYSGQFYLAELIIYNSKLDNTDRAAVECYLGQKYAITDAATNSCP